MTDANRPSDPGEGRNFEQGEGDGPPQAKPRGRGSSVGDSSEASALPGQEFGAGGQLDDGPDESAGADQAVGGREGRGADGG